MMEDINQLSLLLSGKCTATEMERCEEYVSATDELVAKGGDVVAELDEENNTFRLVATIPYSVEIRDGDDAVWLIRECKRVGFLHTDDDVSVRIIFELPFHV